MVISKAAGVSVELTQLCHSPHDTWRVFLDGIDVGTLDHTPHIEIALGLAYVIVDASSTCISSEKI